MLQRRYLGALLLAGILVPLTSCNNSPGLTSIVVSPNTMSFGGAGLTTQLTAIGYYSQLDHPAQTKDITDQVNWTSSTPACVTVSSTGLITSGEADCSNILVSASAQGFNGVITGTMTVNVTISTTSGGGSGDISTLAIIPTSQTVSGPGQTAQFLAIGTASGGGTVNLTNAVRWSSSAASVATVTGTGLATAVTKGSTTITAVYTNADGSAATGTASFTVSGGASEPLTNLSIIPGSTAVTVSQTAQFLAIGVSGSTGLTVDVTKSSQLTWSSSIPTIATVKDGLVTGVAPGSTTITGEWTNPDGSVETAQVTATVTSAAAPEPLLSLNVVPGDTTVWYQSQTQQYLAFGTYSTAPTYRDLTSAVKWISLDPQVASIDNGGVDGATGGLATAQGYTGLAVIYAEATNPDGTVVLSNPVTFTCENPNPVTSGTTTIYPANECDPGPAPTQTATLTVYNVGTNTTNWLVTAPSSSGAANLIHCGPGSKSGGSVCVGNYPSGSTVTLTASPTGSSFGGWSANCDSAPNTPDLSPTCTITLDGNESVGAIFN
jgi:hypothetical protein